MARHSVLFSCGHNEITNIYYGNAQEKWNKIAYLEKNGICSECRKKLQDIENAQGCEEVEMHYKEYKENYSHCKTKSDSYNGRTKTIIVYVPIDA